MKNKFLKLILLGAAIVFLANTMHARISFAEEEIGFVKRTWRKFLKKISSEKEKPASGIRPSSSEAPTPPGKIEPRISPLSKWDSEELTERIEHDLMVYGDELASYIPQLKKKVDKDGKVSYVYVDDVLGERTLKDLPREVLEALYGRVRNEATRLQQERITRQLESIRQATQRPPAPVMPPTQIPIPAPPPQTPQIPKTPAPPPRVPDIPRR